MGVKRILLGMSGGVDSAAAAVLLLREGYDVEGATLLLEETAGAADAAKAAAALGIPHRTVELRDVFRREVMDVFAAEYRAGRTPNPCVLCNRAVKFGAMLRYALDNGFDGVATGHYARLTEKDGRTLLLAAPTDKDQSYMLYALSQEQLSRAVFPLGELTKEDARALAREAGLDAASKPESQDICFVPDGDYASYIREYTGRESVPGNFVLADGTVVGQHKGIIHYTVGQRKGLGLSMGMPVFVLEIRPETNEIVVGPAENALTRTVRADQVNFMAIPDLTAPRRVWAKIRYNHRGAWCTVEKTGEDEILCTFEEPQRAVTPGQAVVLYEDDCVLGGGTIRGNDKTR